MDPLSSTALPGLLPDLAHPPAPSSIPTPDNSHPTLPSKPCRQATCTPTHQCAPPHCPPHNPPAPGHQTSLTKGLLTKTHHFQPAQPSQPCSRQHPDHHGRRRLLSLPRLAFPDPATERSFRSYSAIHRPISDATAALIVLFAIFPSVGIRVVTLHSCPCTSGPSPPLCHHLPNTSPAARQLLDSFPCSGTWPQQSFWWAHHWPQASYRALFQPSVVEFGWLCGGMLVLVLLAPASRAAWYHRVRLAAVLAMRVGTFVLSAATVVAFKTREQPSYVDVHFSRYTMWGATALMWHALMHAVPFDLHWRLALLEWACIALCIFFRNPHLLTSATALTVLFSQVSIGLLLPTCVLYIMEAFQRRNFLALRQQLQQQQPLPFSRPTDWSLGNAGLQRSCKFAGKALNGALLMDSANFEQPPDAAAYDGQQQQDQEQQLVLHERQPLQEPQPLSQQEVPAEAHAAPAVVVAAVQPELSPAGALSSRLGKSGRGASLYRPYSAGLLVSVKIQQPPSALEHDPMSLIKAIQASTLQAMYCPTSSRHTGQLLAMKHAVIRGCIQLLLWVHTGPRAIVQAAANMPATTGSSRQQAEDGSCSVRLSPELQEGLEAAARAAALDACAAAAVGAAGDVAGSAAAAAVEVSVSAVQLHGRAGRSVRAASTSVTSISRGIGSSIHSSCGSAVSDCCGTPGKLAVCGTAGGDMLGSQQWEKAAGHSLAGAMCGGVCGKSAVAAEGQLGGWEEAEFWLEGGAVCLQPGQQELRVVATLGGACVWGGGGDTNVVPGHDDDVDGDGVIEVLGVRAGASRAAPVGTVGSDGSVSAGLRVVVLEGRTGELLLDAQAVLDGSGKGAQATMLRVPLQDLRLPSQPAPLQLLLLPADPARGEVLWSCPLLAGMPVAVALELHALYPSMLAAQTCLSHSDCGAKDQHGLAEDYDDDDDDEPPPVSPVQLAALEAQVSGEVYLPFVSELCLVAWPPACPLPLMHAGPLPDSSASGLTPQQVAAATASAANGSPSSQQQELALHVLLFLKTNDLIQTIAWVCSAVSKAAVPAESDECSEHGAVPGVCAALGPVTACNGAPSATALVTASSGDPKSRCSASVQQDAPGALASDSPAALPAKTSAAPAEAGSTKRSKPGTLLADGGSSFPGQTLQTKGTTSTAGATQLMDSPPAGTIIAAILRGGFTDASLERQYQQYHLASTTALDGQGCILQLLLALLQIPKASSACDILILVLMSCSMLAALGPLLWFRRWPSCESRRQAMLLPQLVTALPAAVYLMSGWQFPPRYREMWQQFWLLPLGYFTLLAVWLQAGLKQTALRSILYISLYLPLCRLDGMPTNLLAFTCLAVGPTAAASAMEFMQRRAFLRSLPAGRH